MKINFLLLKVIVKKNISNYLFIVILTVAMLSFIKVSVGLINTLISTDYITLSHNEYMNFRINGLKIMLIIMGIMIIISQYYRVMMMNCDSYNMFKKLGATRLQIQFLIIMQNICMVIFTIPFVLLVEYILYNKLILMLHTDQSNIMVANSFLISMMFVTLLIAFVIVYVVILCKQLKTRYPISIDMGR